jgi:hypothetical protein
VSRIGSYVQVLTWRFLTPGALRLTTLLSQQQVVDLAFLNFLCQFCNVLPSFLRGFLSLLLLYDHSSECCTSCVLISAFTLKLDENRLLVDTISEGGKCRGDKASHRRVLEDS